MPVSVNLLESIQSLVEGRYIDVAAGCLFIFDCFITLDLEVKYMWKSKLNMVEVMYFINRYTTIIDIVLICLRSSITNITHCPGIMKTEIVVYILGVYFAEYTFAMRAYIIWQKKWMIWVPLCLYYIGTFIYNFIIYYSILNPAQYVRLQPFNGCIPISPVSFRWSGMMFLVAYDSVMIILISLAAAIGAWRDGTIIRSHLYRVLYGEGILFYICLLALSVTSLITIKFFETPIFIFMGRCVRSILASRVILHIRETASHRQGQILGNTTNHAQS